MQYLRKHAIADVWVLSEPMQSPKPGVARMQKAKAVRGRIAESSSSDVRTNKLPALQRKEFEKNAAQSKVAKKRRWLPAKGWLQDAGFTNTVLVGMAGLVFVVGMAAALHSLWVDRQITSTVLAQPQEGDSASAPSVDEKAPTPEDIRAYSVAPDMPRLLRIPALDVTSRVQHVGLDESGALGAPYNVHDVAWYSDSVKPGSPGGVSVIDGHVTGITQKGVFHKLDQLQAGDDIYVERGDGTKIAYRVVRVETVDVQRLDMAKILLPATIGKHGLNLISCTGKFNSATSDYEQRVLVFAEAV